MHGSELHLSAVLILSSLLRVVASLQFFLQRRRKETTAALRCCVLERHFTLPSSCRNNNNNISRKRYRKTITKMAKKSSSSSPKPLPPLCSTACVGDFVDDHLGFLKTGTVTTTSELKSPKKTKSKRKSKSHSDPFGMETVTDEIMFACSDVHLSGDLNPFIEPTPSSRRSTKKSRKSQQMSAIDEYDDEDEDDTYDEDSEDDDDEDDYDDYDDSYRKSSSRRKSQKSSNDMEDSVKLNVLWELEKKLQKQLSYLGEGRGRGRKSWKKSSRTKSNSHNRRGGMGYDDGYDDLVADLRRRVSKQSSNVAKTHAIMDDNTTLTTLTELPKDGRDNKDAASAGTSDSVKYFSGRSQTQTQDVFRPKSSHNMDELTRKYGDLKIMTSSNRVNSNSDSEWRQEPDQPRYGRETRDRGRSSSPRRHSSHGQRQSYINPYYQEEADVVIGSTRKKSNRWVHQPSPPGMTADEMEQSRSSGGRKEPREAPPSRGKKANKVATTSTPSNNKGRRVVAEKAGYSSPAPAKPTKKTDSPKEAILDAEDMYHDAYMSKKNRDVSDLKERLGMASRRPPSIDDYLQETLSAKMERANQALRRLDQPSHSQHQHRHVPQEVPQQSSGGLFW